MANSDPYKALSFDKLHTLDAGLFGQHMWSLLKAYVDSVGNKAPIQVDKQYVFSPIQLQTLKCILYYSSDSVQCHVGQVSFTMIQL